MTPMQAKLLLGILGLTGLVAGIVAVGKGWPALSATLFELPGWNEVEGRVLAASLEAGDAAGARFSHDSRRSARSDVYRPKIEYAYTVDGKEYTSDRFSLIEMASSDRVAQQAIVDRYAVGTSVTVYVDPADPSRVVLDRESLMQPALLAGVGALFAVIGLALLIVLVVLVMKGYGTSSPGVGPA